MGAKRKQWIITVIIITVLTNTLFFCRSIRIHAATVTVNNAAVRILGYRYHVAIKGYCVVYGIEPMINGKSVVRKGLIYGAVFAGAKEEQMTVDNNSFLVYKVTATAKGEISDDYEISNTMKYYAVTMKENGDFKEAIDASYMVRAYAVLNDGSVIYSSIYHYSIYKICNSLYRNCYMEDEASHNWIYENILKVSNPDYEEIEYSWGSVVTP